MKQPTKLFLLLSSLLFLSTSLFSIYAQEATASTFHFNQTN